MKLPVRYVLEIRAKDSTTLEYEWLDYPSERERGEWIRHENPPGVFSRECSNCMCWFPWDMPRNSFCPNCGADMRPKDGDEE